MWFRLGICRAHSIFELTQRLFLQEHGTKAAVPQWLHCSAREGDKPVFPSSVGTYPYSLPMLMLVLGGKPEQETSLPPLFFFIIIIFGKVNFQSNQPYLSHTSTTAIEREAAGQVQQEAGRGMGGIAPVSCDPHLSGFEAMGYCPPPGDICITCIAPEIFSIPTYN